MIHRHIPIAALLAVFVLSACSLDDLPLLEQRQPQQVITAPTVVLQAATATAEPVADEPRPTSAPLPTVDPVATLEPELTNVLEEEQQVLIELYRRVNPAVVSIEVVGDHPPIDGVEEELFPFGQGSGFLFDDQGHIVTNNHVVEGGKSFQVGFADGSIFEARLVGTDPGSDLAVLKVDELPPNAAPLRLANSREVEVGQTAIAIGNPFALRNTLTVGVVSGIGRALDGPRSPDGAGNFSIPNVIQTDAAINPGNSGGPLLNVRGEVIGVNTAISTDSGAFQGVGYAVPSNAVTRVVPALISTGRYEHPWIGISMWSVDPLFAQQFDLTAQQGVLITDVRPGSPADAASLQAGDRQAEYLGRPINYDGDIITAINGQTVRDSDDLISYLELETAVGDVVTFTIMRDGAEEQIDLTLGRRPTE
jgi:2-alkenal reductase